MMSEATAVELLEHSGLRPTDPDERARLLAGYGACRELAGRLWEVPLGDVAPWLLPHDG